MRLDKILASSGIGTRSEVRRLIASGAVAVNGVTICKSDSKVSLEDEITVNGKAVQGQTKLYYLLDKPDGVLTAMEDPRLANVGDFIPASLRGKKLAPVGRLDYHTSGLLIITNDGTLSHRLQSPKYKIAKTYLAEYKGCEWTPGDISELKEGITLTDMDEPVKLAPAVLEPLDDNKAYITLTEGKTHEVRRIFAKYGKEVLSLRRIRLADLVIDVNEEAQGQLRPLTSGEIDMLRQAVGLGESDGDN